MAEEMQQTEEAVFSDELLVQAFQAILVAPTDRNISFEEFVAIKGTVMTALVVISERAGLTNQLEAAVDGMKELIAKAKTAANTGLPDGFDMNAMLETAKTSKFGAN